MRHVGRLEFGLADRTAHLGLPLERLRGPGDIIASSRRPGDQRRGAEGNGEADDRRIDAGQVAEQPHETERRTGQRQRHRTDADRVDVIEMRAAVLASNGDPIPRRLSLYVHVPFCLSPCFYCGCNRIITRDKSRAGPYLRSEEHTSELQSLMRNSYAVFCLK